MKRVGYGKVNGNLIESYLVDCDVPDCRAKNSNEVLPLAFSKNFGNVFNALIALSFSALFCITLAKDVLAVPSGPLNGSPNAKEDAIDKDVVEDEDENPERLNDPFEKFNRGIFWFNDHLDMYFLEPVAKGYKAVLPAPVRRCVRNFFNNAKTPVYVLSDIVQLKFDQAGEHTGRFLINSTLGLLGLADPATPLFKAHKDADFGIALGYHGVQEGPYLVLPVLGPSNVRDAAGRIVDTFASPVSYVASAFDVETLVVYGAYALDGIDQRARLIDAVESAKESSTDYYSFIQSTYHQIRQNQIYDNDPPDE